MYTLEIKTKLIFYQGRKYTLKVVINKKGEFKIPLAN